MESGGAFPQNSAMWPGCVLASVAHAVFLCRAPLMAYERSWNSSIYRVTDSQGTNGAVVFGENRRQFVAALRSRVPAVHFSEVELEGMQAHGCWKESRWL